MRHTRKILVLLAMLLWGVGVVYGADVLQNTVCTVGPDDVIEGNLYVLCRELTIDGRVNGNVIGAAFTAQINGIVEKNIYLASAHLEVNGVINDDLHFGGIALDIYDGAELGEGGDVITAGLSARLDEGAVIPGDVIGFGYQWIVAGDVSGGIDFWGSALSVGGQVERGISTVVGDSRSSGVAGQIENLLFMLPFEVELVDPGLIVQPDAMIEGDLYYQSPAAGTLDGRISGEVTFDEVTSEPTLADLVEQEESRITALEAYIRQFFREFAALLVVGLVILLVAPQSVRTPLYTLRQRPLSSLGAGVLTFILSFPIVLLAFMLSLLILLLLAILRLDSVALVSGVVLGVMNFGGASVFYLMAIFGARVVACLALGRLVTRRFTVTNSTRSWYLSLIAGVGLLAIFASLPSVGWLFNALALFLGLGAILHVTLNWLRTVREGAVNRYAAAGTNAETVIMPLSAAPPPMIDEKPLPRGMENLPEGFSWWDD